MISKYRKWRLWPLLLASALIGAMFIVGCGAATETEQQPAQQPAAAPAASQQQAAPAAGEQQAASAQPAAQPAAQQQSGSGTTDSSAAPAQEPAQKPQPTPTTVAQAALAPVSEPGMGPRQAPEFASYWKPPTAFYGEPLYGGTLRINYEDPLEHANVWGARSGTTIRYRVPTHDTLIQNNPYDPAAPFIPGLARGWTVDDDLKGVTFFLKDNVDVA